ncbi:MAG: hypothetical protein NXH72_14245 [Hyphomonadaceae bacterium]|nr:hypothetical protein [Hyphomonadaceae bacterium]
MRCSECFAEMKEGPDGLVCELCGTSLAPLVEDGLLPPPENAPKSSNGWLIWLAASLGVVLVIGAGLLATQTDILKSLIGDRSNASAATSDSSSWLQAGASPAIVGSVVLSEESENLQLFADQKCQPVPPGGSDAVLALEWIGVDGERIAGVTPQFPRNWRLETVCRERTGRMFASASLSDGVAITEILSNGALAWTRILPAVSTDAASVDLFFGEAQIQALTPSERRGQFSLAAFDFDGAMLWQREIENVDPLSRPRIATNNVGDTVIAWNVDAAEPGVSVRVRAVSPQNTINYERTLADRSVPVSYLVSDDLARSVLIEGRAGFSVQFLDATGAPVWRRWIDADAAPIGVIQDGADYVLAALKGTDILLWRVRADGTRTEPLSLNLAKPVASATLHPVSDVRAVLALETETVQRGQLAISLPRLREALPAPDTSTESLPDLDLSPVEETAEIGPLAENAAEATATPVEPDRLPDPTPVRVPATEPDTTPAQPAVDERQEVVTEPQPTPPQVAAPTPEIAEASCTFRCAAAENPAATYPILQSVPLDEGEDLSSLVARLGDTHKQLCELSGGQPVVESAPDCIAQ